MFGSIVISELFLICKLNLTDWTCDFESNSSRFKLGSFRFLIFFCVFFLRFDLLLSPRHLSLSLSLSTAIFFSLSPTSTISFSQVLHPLLDPQLTTMSDQGEKTCPLCAEEMDLTDQQLKPCKCGYEICVWCWHHIMDMAEKDDTEGRCPACRVPYDKEKIVGTAENCGRLVAEINTERKMKSQKAKTNKASSEGRKQLSSVRVIQRNLVYIVGLPLTLADEDLLQHKEYFGQYGNVLKVSMSRTAAGVIQQFPNNTCSVYITYAKEDEAIRCIQSVHGYVLEGRSLKACFGTTKYCHAWLRNVPCSNPDCLYLHEIGSQEDSFTKDEIISAYTRVQQITGATNNLQRRSGNVLPPPADEIYINSTPTGKPLVKNASNNSSNIIRDSPPNSSSGRSTALPAGASWGMRALNFQPPAASAPSSNGPSKHKPDAYSGPLAFSSAVATTPQASIVYSDEAKKSIMNDEGHTMQSKGKMDSSNFIKQHTSIDSRITVADKQVTTDGSPAISGPQPSKDVDVGIMPPKITNSVDAIRRVCDSGPDKDGSVSFNGKIQSLCSEISSMGIDNRRDEYSGFARPNSSVIDHMSSKSPASEVTPQYYAEPLREPLTSTPGWKATSSINGIGVLSEHDWRSDSRTQVVPDTSSEVEDDLQSFNDQRLKDPEVFGRSSYLLKSDDSLQRLKDPEVVSRSPYMLKSDDSLHISNHSREHSLHYPEAYREANYNVDPLFVHRNAHEGPLTHSSSTSVVANGFPENFISSSTSFDRAVDHSYLRPDEGKGKQMGRFQGNASNIDSNAAVDMGESSIISNILSMDFDAWDDPLTSPQNLAKLLGETDKQHGSLKLSSSWKVQNSNQSRFSFARQEESKIQEFNVDSSFNAGRVSRNHSFSQDFVENRVPNLDKLGNFNSFSSSNIEEYDNIGGRQFVTPSKLSVSRAQISAPPGFSVPSRAPPPGFSSHERMDQTFETLTGNQLLNNSSFMRNPYQAAPTVNNSSNGDVEFIDPAILAVGKGRLPGGLNNPGLDMRSNFPSQYGAYENEARLQMLMQRSVSPQQNLRYTDMGDGFSPINDAYGIQSRLMEQTQSNNLSPYAQLSHQQSRNSLLSNGHWDGWSDAQGGNNLGMADLLRNERLGYNKYYTGYEDSKFRMPSSGDLYNRTFGM